MTREAETGVRPHMPGISDPPPHPSEARGGKEHRPSPSCLWRECSAGDAVITALPTSCQFGASGLQNSVQVDFCRRGRL